MSAGGSRSYPLHVRSLSRLHPLWLFRSLCSFVTKSCYCSTANLRDRHTEIGIANACVAVGVSTGDRLRFWREVSGNNCTNRGNGSMSVEGSSYCKLKARAIALLSFC